MKEYEITYLANPQLAEADKDKLDGAIDTAISELEGEITSSLPATGSPGSRRRLHYPISKHRLSWLRTLQINLDPSRIEQLRQTMKKQAGVIRLSVLQTPPREAVSTAIFDNLAEREKRSTEAAPKEETKPVTMTEVEAGIEKALEEEVK